MVDRERQVSWVRQGGVSPRALVLLPECCWWRSVLVAGVRVIATGELSETDEVALWSRLEVIGRIVDGRTGAEAGHGADGRTEDGR